MSFIKGNLLILFEPLVKLTGPGLVRDIKELIIFHA